MPINDSKRPEKYPASWHVLVLQAKASGEVLQIAPFDTQKEGLALAKKFRAFLRSFFKYPAHSTARELSGYRAKTFVREWAPGCWELAVKVARTPASLIEEQLKGESHGI